jgi:hypothetical protein
MGWFRLPALIFGDAHGDWPLSDHARTNRGQRGRLDSYVLPDQPRLPRPLGCPQGLIGRAFAGWVSGEPSRPG